MLPNTTLDGLTRYELPRLKARLVAHRRHPLSKLARVTRDELSEHVLLTVRGSDPRLHLATAELDTQSTVHLPDFHSKKSAILEGIGFGWLPEWLIERELEKGELRPLQLARGAVHVFEPQVFTRGPLGRAGAALLHQLLHP